jgi:hypothetical protein
VPLARLAKRVFTADEKLEAGIEVAHFGPAPLENEVAEWSLIGEYGKAAAAGKLPPQTVPLGNGTSLGRVSVDLGAAGVRAPAHYRLIVRLAGTPFENDWGVWVYPPQVDTRPPPGVTVVRELDASALAALRGGGRVLL